MNLAVVSQIWVQHLQCGQIIGHCHFRVGSVLEPELGGALYSALNLTLEEVENTHNCCVSGVYGFQIPDIEGIGLFTIQNENFRIYFLCEGLYNGEIPHLAGVTITKKLNKMFGKLKQKEKYFETCRSGHKIEGELFWFNFMSSIGLKGHISLEVITKVYPIRLIRIKLAQNKENDPKDLRDLEVVKLGSLGHGWKDIEQLVTAKIDGIFTNPTFSYSIYQTLFQQFKEHIPNFRPQTVVLTYDLASQNETVLLAFLFFRKFNLNIKFCLPVNSEFKLEGDQSILSSLQSSILNSR
ncbi:MAG: hypothetical protein ACXAC8_03255 [Candidatus Hodarchaeales archaeon]|jgi:hypothetical protein